MSNNLYNKDIEEIAVNLQGEYWATYVDIQMYIMSTNIPHNDQIKIVQNSALILNEAMEKGNSVESVIGDNTAEFCKRAVKEIYTSLSYKKRVGLFLEKLLFGASAILLFFSILLIIDFIFNKNIILQSNGNVKIELVKILSLIMAGIWFSLINKTNKKLKKPSLIKKTIIFILYIIPLFIFSLIIFSLFDAIAPENLYFNPYLLLGLTFIMIVMTILFSKFINK